MKKTLILLSIAATSYCLAAHLQVENAGFEESTGSMGDPAANWIGNSAWYEHAAASKPNNETLGANFGYYTPSDLGGVWMAHTILSNTFQEGMTYLFKSWAVGGGNDMGLATYEIGYLPDEMDYNSFVQLDRISYSLDGVTQWEPYEGAFHTVQAGAAETGSHICVRFGVSSSDDVWLDAIEVIETNYALATLPHMPTNMTPADSAAAVIVQPTLTASPFVADSTAHDASLWHIDINPTFANPVHESGITTADLTSYTPPELSTSTRYYWRVKYRDSDGNWSPWSEVTSFDTISTNILNYIIANGDFEASDSAVYTPATNWVGNNAWAPHTSHPKPNNETLGAKFGYYTPLDLGGVWMGHEELLITYQEGTTYNFSSWAVGGGNDMGLAVYELGYIPMGSDYTDFVSLDRMEYSLDGVTQWEQYPGSFHTVQAGAPEIGQKIMIRFGISGSDDVWVDSATISQTNYPAGTLPLAPTNTLPADGEIQVSTTPTFEASPYVSPSATAQAGSIWQLCADGTFIRPTYSSGVTGPISQLTVPSNSLSTAETYYWRVKYQDAEGRWGPWSEVTSFDTEFTFLKNGGFENNPGSTAEIDPPTHWGPDGESSWTSHEDYPRPGNEGLGLYFGYHNPYEGYIMVQTTAYKFTGDTIYQFSSYAYPGGNDTGTINYAIGYLLDPFDMKSFDALALTNFSITGQTSWQWYPGIEHYVSNGAWEVGEYIAVGFVADVSETLGDIWVDEANLEIIPEPVTVGILLVAIVGFFIRRK